MKKILALLLIFTFSIALLLIFFAKNPINVNSTKIESSEIDNQNKVADSISTVKEIESNPEVKPEVADTKTSEPKKEVIKFQDRFVDGELPKNLDNLEFINQINPNWKSNLAKNLMHLLPVDSKITITHEKEIVRFFGENRAQYAEIVLIKTILPSQKNSSYHALIDSSSSKVLNTWDFDRVEL